MRVLWHPDAEGELNGVPVRERAAILNATAKLNAEGIALGYPHTTKIARADLRELRPRRGRSPWRALYRRVGDAFVIGAVSPEAAVDP